MKPKLTSQIALTAMLALASAVSHAANEPKARVLRLRLNEGAATWRMSLNGQDLDQGLPSGNLTNQLTELSLRHGDVLILSLPQHKFEPPVQSAKEWLSRYCQSNRVAIYIYGNTE